MRAFAQKTRTDKAGSAVRPMTRGQVRPGPRHEAPSLSAHPHLAQAPAFRTDARRVATYEGGLKAFRTSSQAPAAQGPRVLAGLQPGPADLLALGGDGPSGALGGAATSVSTGNLTGPEWKNNGEFKWWINWVTDGTSGWIVQKIENTYSGTRADGTPITNASVGAVPTYYEAWDVSSAGAVGPANRDQWERPALGALGSQTSFSMKGTVYWTSTDPAASGFTPRGVSNAGILLSSLSAPAGLSAPLLVRSAYGSWASSGAPALPGCFTS